MIPIWASDRRKPQGIRSGATGLMTSIVGWRRHESAVMVDGDSMGRAGNIRTDEPQPPIPGTCVGGRRVRRARAWRPGDARPTCRSRRPIFSRRSTGPASISARMPATAAARPARAHRSRRSPPHQQRFSGVIGGVQAGYNWRLSVRAAARRRSRSHLSELSHLEFDRRRARDAAHPTSSSNGTMSAPCAAASATPAVTGCSMPPAASPMPASASSTRLPVGDEEKHHQRPARLGRRRRRRICLRAALERAAGISLQPVRKRRRPACRRARNTRRRWISSRCASASTARSTGRDRRAGRRRRT